MVRRLIACLIPIFVITLFYPMALAQDFAVPPMPPPPPDVHEPMPPIPDPPPDTEPHDPDDSAPPLFGGEEDDPYEPDVHFETNERSPIAPPAPPPAPEMSPPTYQDEPSPGLPHIDMEIPPTEDLPVIQTDTGVDWPMFRGTLANTGYTEERLDFPLKLKWQHIAPVPASELGRANPVSPAVADGIIYFTAGRRLYAVHAETGSLRWAYPSQEQLTAPIRSSPFIGESLVYFGGGEGRVYAITKDSGALAWSFLTRGSVNSSPVVVDGTLFVGSDDNHLYALDPITGQMKWRSGFRTRDDVSSSPAVVDGLVYFISRDMTLYAAHSGTGALRWATKLGGFSRTNHPVVADNTVYVAAGNVMQAYQSKSGRLQWLVNLDSQITTAPAVGRGSIYFGCRDGMFYSITNAGRANWGGPVDLGAPIYGSPMIAGDTVIVGTNKGAVVALNADTGDIKWRYTITHPVLEQIRFRSVNVSASPVVSNGTLYILSDDGTLHAFSSDAADHTPPNITTVVPTRGMQMPGTPPIEIGAIMSDPGSGINYDTVTLTLNGEVVEHVARPERGVVVYKTPVTQPLVPLPNGMHTVTLSVSDWAGNEAETTWTFTVDNSIRRRADTGTATPAQPPRR